MSRAVIRLGDDTSHGGRVIEATARMTIDGIPVALWGDHCSCPIDGHESCVICEGEVQALYDGRPVALEGHKTTCGATLIASQHHRCISTPLTSSDAMRDKNLPLRGANSDAYRDAHTMVPIDPKVVVPGSDLKTRRMYVIQGGGAVFPIASNPSANPQAPISEIHAFNTVKQYSDHINTVAAPYHLDPDLIRSIIYMEQTHGCYDVVALGRQKTILPMNVHSRLWGNFVGTREQLDSPTHNITAGARILSGIQNNLNPEDRNVPKIATLYNSLGAEQVNDYGARVAAIYQQKPWLAKP